VRFDSVVVNRAGRSTESWSLGPATVETPVVRVSGTRLLGAELMSRFAWTFDTRGRRVRIAAASAEPLRLPAERGTGLVLRPRGAGAGAWFEVYSGLPGTPAEASEVRAGDRLLAVDGVPVAERGCVGVTETAADSLRLTIRRDGEELELPVGVDDLVP